MGLHPPFPLSAKVSIRTVIRHRASPEFIRSRDCITDDVHYRESVGTGPVVLKVGQQTGALYSGNPMDQLMCALFSHTHYWYYSGYILQARWRAVCCSLS